MPNTYDTTSPKRPIKLTVNRDLLRIAKTLNINVSTTLEQALAEKVREQQRQTWLAECQQAMDDYNQFIENNGVFSDCLRKF